MHGILKTDAVILSVSDLGESDRLVTFYTPGNGKFKAVAKGAKRSRRRFLNVLEPFTLIRLGVVPPRTDGLGHVDAAEVCESFPAIRADMQLFCMASLCCEMVDRWTRELDPHREVFHLLVWCLKALDSTSSHKKIALFFKVKLLGLVGYAPDWTKCSMCKDVPVGKIVQVTLKDGGFICEGCANRGSEARVVSLGTLKTLHHIQQRPLTALGRLIISDSALTEAWALIKALHSYRLHMTPLAYHVIEGCERRSWHLGGR
ncbi:DNA repair protein RecO [Dissulfurimicrobium hydrothermale]|uniref:DNA repair protein RecO n=1 Tax=Dissulfurimicrobium hydrothermale TaxID=1750598 RepID=UPI001EDAC460|nr:DNA repair protein RecO [Dissulfurimicrobium hydrothermale]UKL13076.1 DNA repair protein RecO [Dissulfurimicrobium hydrothermale]